MKDILVIYHGNCTDGFGAAYAAWKKFDNSADYLPIIFGEPIPDLRNKDVYILDFSFPKETYLEILKIAKKVVLLDHHEPAYKALCGCSGCFFDLSKSGSVLAWEYFHPHISIPKFMTYIQDGDLLQFNYPETKAFYRGINAIPREFNDWMLFEDLHYLDNIIKEGMALGVFFDSQVQQIIQNAKPFAKVI